MNSIFRRIPRAIRNFHSSPIRSEDKLENYRSIQKANSSLQDQYIRKLQNYRMSHEVATSIESQQNDMFFGTEVLNRVSFLREDIEFVSQAVTHPSTRFVFYSNTNPLVNKHIDEKLVLISNGDGQLQGCETGAWGVEAWKKAVGNWSEFNKNHSPELRDGSNPTFLFLGLEDASVGLDLKALKVEDGDEKYFDYQGRYQGIPYFAVDVTNSKELTETMLNFYNGIVNGDKTAGENEIFFTHSRKHTLAFTHREAAIFSHGKMMLDWLSRNKFCPGCGTKVIPIHAGGKLTCTNEKKTEDKYECPVKSGGVSNVTFPRTDAVIITAITNVERTKVLLSLSKRFGSIKMYSCTAGFMEPSETVEVATRREIWEETGVVASKVNIVMTQPWPFPGNLMIGCLGVVEFNGTNEIIHLGHDKELADARWFDIDFVRKMVYQNEVVDLEEFNPENILLPMPESIAFLLIKLIVDQNYGTTKL